MIRVSRTVRRRGATVVECAIIYPITFLLMLGLIIGGLGVFRYQEISSVAREGARWASVHGYQSAAEASSTGVGTPTTASDVYTNAIKPQADASSLSPAIDNKKISSSTGTDANGGATVSVTVTYDFNLITNYPGIPNPYTVSRTVTMQQEATTPTNFPAASP